ncbi:hypothetical protein C8D72_2013 [Kushneria indalinina DSM 14324]|uniref:Uncharacterized protein n=1 Tax=Kushneria indalinina DSM 14324 TaxID=1122140 RepID=A0A3D9DWM1_9GAMM|nr:hypothetical protein C8D72_2013 [Kushneria indalinina DSM 14324]
MLLSGGNALSLDLMPPGRSCESISTLNVASCIVRYR